MMDEIDYEELAREERGGAVVLGGVMLAVLVIVVVGAVLFVKGCLL